MKLAYHKIVGWGLIALFGVLFGSVVVTGLGHSPGFNIFALLGLFFPAALLLLPGIIVLKRRWDQLATIISGLFCIILFFISINQAKDLVSALEQHAGDQHWWPFAALIILILAWVLPFKVHRLLERRLRQYFEGKPDEARDAVPPSVDSA